MTEESRYAQRKAAYNYGTITPELKVHFLLASEESLLSSFAQTSMRAEQMSNDRLLSMIIPCPSSSIQFCSTINRLQSST